MNTSLERLPEPVTLHINTYAARANRGVVSNAGACIITAFSPEGERYHHTLGMQTYISPEGIYIATARSSKTGVKTQTEMRNSFMVTNPYNDPEAAIDQFLSSQYDELITSFWGLERVIELSAKLRATEPISTKNRKLVAVFTLLPEAIDLAISLQPPIEVKSFKETPENEVA